MHKTRNKNNKSNSESDNDLDLDKSLDLDEPIQKNNDSDEDFIDNSDMSDEIEKKIESIYERNRNSNIKTGKDDNDFFDIKGKEEKKKKEKYEKKIMKNNFNDYFDASHNKIEDYYEVNYPELNNYELKIDLYSDFYRLLDKGKIFPSLSEYMVRSKDKEKKKVREEELEKNQEDARDESNNIINKGNLFDLMYELLFQKFNVFLYGFGSKMHLIYQFIEYYHKKYWSNNNTPLYIISVNLNNTEISMKVIINKIESCLMIEFEKCYGVSNNDKKFTTESTIDGQILKIKKIYNEMQGKLNDKLEHEDEKDSSLEEDDDDEVDNNIKKEKDIKNNSKTLKNVDIFEENIPFKILLVIHNIGSPVGQSKIFQENLSDLANKLDFIYLLVSCENLTIPYYWTTEVKDRFKFCFLKFNTFEPYDAEIDENNLLKGGNNIKAGYGLKEIFSSFTDAQKRLIKEIAKLNLKGDYDKLTPKGLIDYFVNTGIGIATDIQKLESLILEAIDHEIVVLKLSNVNNKEIYKMTLDRNVIEKIAEGEYM